MLSVSTTRINRSRLSTPVGPIKSPTRDPIPDTIISIGDPAEDQ